MIKHDRIKILDQCNCNFVRNRGKEVYVKSTSLRTETFYKAGVVGELAQHSETHDSATQVKNEVAGRKSIHLPGEPTALTKTENPRGLHMKGRTEEVEITGGFYE